MNKSHFFMVQTYTTFVDSEGKTGIDNDCTVVQSDGRALNVRGLTHAQQGAQFKLFKKIGEQVNVLNITFGAISYLGEMTDEEWNPDGVSPESESAANDTVN